MRHVIHIIGIIICAAIILLLAILGWGGVLSAIVVPDGDLQEWLVDFTFWAKVSIGASAFFVLLWYLIMHFNKVTQYNTPNGKRALWGIFFALQLLVPVVPVFMLTSASYGWAAHLFNFLDNFLCFYIATVLFSPVGYKYIPPGAALLRRW